MTTAQEVLIIGGVLNIAYGLLTGIPAGIIRQSSPTYSKYLRFVHIGALMWGPMLISLAFVLELTDLADTTETLASWLMVGASFLLNLKDTGIQDEFGENARLPLALGGVSSLASLAGIAIILYGVVI